MIIFNPIGIYQIGEIYDIQHIHKGDLVLQVTRQDDETLTGVIVIGDANECGEEITVCKSFILKASVCNTKMSIVDELVEAIKSLERKLYEMADAYNDRSCDHDVCVAVRKGRAAVAKVTFAKQKEKI